MNKIILVFLLKSIMTFAQTEFNTLDENGKKHGVWKGFFEESKRVRYQGTFEHGQEVGVFNYFDDTKEAPIIGTRIFNPKDNSVYTTFFDQKKNIVSEGRSIGKLKEGVWKYYHENSNIIMTIENYKTDQLQGKRTVFYKNGAIAEEINYTNGYKNGIYKSYTEKGIVLESSIYKNNELDGLAIYRDSRNFLVTQGLYKDGKKIGIWNFYKDGKFESKTNFNFQGKKFEKRKNKV